jgi:hypothetical protein
MGLFGSHDVQYVNGIIEYARKEKQTKGMSLDKDCILIHWKIE